MLNENEISQKSRAPLSVFYQKGLHYFLLPQCGECYYYDSEDRRCSKYYNKKNVRSNSPACADYEVDD
ncbi:MAG: hypothetical protein J6L83_01485 [Clostridia bacterium]|nr:hypothetical protein [Clostridia bacterium]